MSSHGESKGELLPRHALTVVTEGGEIQRYLGQVERYPLLSAEEEYRLATRYRDQGEVEAAHRLVTAHLRYVVRIAREYGGYGLRLMDLVQEGSVGLMQAVKKFDPDKGFRLATYAVWWIRAAIHEHILRSWSLVKVATTAAQRKLFFGLRRCKETIGWLDAEGAREVGRKLGVDPALVLEMDGRLAGPDLTLNRPATEDGEEVQNLLPSPRPDAEALLLQRERTRLTREAAATALAALTPREREVIARRVMSDAPATLETLGAELGVSRERVRQVEKRALEKMRLALEEAAPAWR